MGPWHHVGATMEVTLDKKWIIRVIRWELNPINLNLDLTFFMNIYIYDYGGHQLRLRCAQVHHRSLAGTFTRVPGRCLRWSPTAQGPRWPPQYIVWKGSITEVLHLFRCYTHTHTPWKTLVAFCLFLQCRQRYHERIAVVSYQPGNPQVIQYITVPWHTSHETSIQVSALPKSWYCQLELQVSEEIIYISIYIYIYILYYIYTILHILYIYTLYI